MEIKSSNQKKFNMHKVCKRRNFQRTDLKDNKLIGRLSDNEQSEILDALYTMTNM